MPAVEPTLFGALGAGTLRFDYGVPLWAFLLLAAALIALTSLGYRKTFRPLTPLWRRGLIAVRSAAEVSLGALLAALWARLAGDALPIAIVREGDALRVRLALPPRENHR